MKQSYESVARICLGASPKTDVCTRRIKADRRQPVVWVVVNGSRSKKRIAVKNFTLYGTPRNPFTAAIAAVNVNPNASAQITSNVKPSAESGTYKYDVEITDPSTGRTTTIDPEIEI